MKYKHSKFLAILSFLSFYISALAETTDPTSLPLIQIEQLEYQGAFVVPGVVYGESMADFVAGPIEYNPVNHSMFVAGKKEDGAIAEFSIPSLVNSTVVSELNTGEIL